MEASTTALAYHEKPNGEFGLKLQTPMLVEER
jgi:hypothetical protein